MSGTEQEKAKPQLAPNELFPFEHISTRYDVKVALGVTLQDLQDPAYWAHHAVKLRPLDEIRARAEDGSWVANLLVLDASRTWARVKVLSEHKLGTADVALTQAVMEDQEKRVAQIKEGFKITFRGPHRHSVVRKSDSNLMSEGHVTKVDAERWLDNYARDQASAPAVAAPA